MPAKQDIKRGVGSAGPQGVALLSWISTVDRGVQVQLMGERYKTAGSTTIWLGESDEHVPRVQELADGQTWKGSFFERFVRMVLLATSSRCLRSPTSWKLTARAVMASIRRRFGYQIQVPRPQDRREKATRMYLQLFFSTCPRSENG
jgi:hypothetical protein